MIRVFLPFKGLQGAKSRWPSLGVKHQSVVLRVLRHNLLTAQAVFGAEHVRILCPDPSLAEHFPGFLIQGCPGLGLNPDLRHARQQLPIGTKSMVVILPDLPGVRASELQELREFCFKSPLVLCPDSKRTGTNAVALSPPGVVDFLFEGSSFGRFSSAAEDLGLQYVVLSTPGLGQDCDDLESLRHFGLA